MNYSDILVLLKHEEVDTTITTSTTSKKHSSKSDSANTTQRRVTPKAALLPLHQFSVLVLLNGRGILLVATTTIAIKEANTSSNKLVRTLCLSDDDETSPKRG